VSFRADVSRPVRRASLQRAYPFQYNQKSHPLDPHAATALSCASSGGQPSRSESACGFDGGAAAAVERQRGGWTYTQSSEGTVRGAVWRARQAPQQRQQRVLLQRESRRVAAAFVAQNRRLQTHRRLCQVSSVAEGQTAAALQRARLDGTPSLRALLRLGSCTHCCCTDSR